MANLVSLDSLSITNFGPFYGTTDFDFSTPEEKSPHVLIGGKNGAGKTHVLRALYLAVVGEAGLGDLRKVETGSDATRFAFGRALNRRAVREGDDTCKLRVAIRQRDADSGKEQILTLHREIRFRPNSPPTWRSWAERSNDGEVEEDDKMIERLRDAFLPRHLARFFFFDAEKSQNVNLGETDIVQAISRILGLWAYERLEEELRNIFQTTNRELTKEGGSEAAEKLGKISGDIQTATGQIKGNELKKSSLIERQEETEAQLADIEDKLKTIGAVDPKKLERDQARREEVAAAKREIETQLEASWESPIPITLLAGLRVAVTGQLEAEERLRTWNDRKAAIEPKLPSIKAEVFSNPEPLHVLAPPTHDYYSNRLDQALLGLFNPPPEGIEGIEIYVCDRPETNFSVRQTLAAASTEVAGLESACQKLERLQADVRDLDYDIRQQNQNIAAIGAGKELHDKRGELRAELESIARELTELDIQKTQLEAELTRLKVEESRWREIDEKATRGRSLASRAHAFRDAASVMRKRASEQMRKQINSLVGELWLEITDRSHEFKGMAFTGEVWQCELIRQNGERLLWDEANPSAGQRQVRLLAFNEALRRLAQTVPPLVVDTPLGRLDREVREAVLDKLYLSHEGHQSIVLATNAEIDPEGSLFAKVRDQFGRGYTLVPEGVEGTDDYQVRLERKYFGKNL